MKRIILLIAFVALSNCDVTPRKSYAEQQGTVSYKTIHGMSFAIFSTTSNYGGVHVVNLTKESLEVELLKKQLKQ